MVRKRSACGRSVRKVRKNKIARASLMEERELMEERDMGSEGVRSQSMDMSSEEKMNERGPVKGVSEERKEFVFGSGGDFVNGVLFRVLARKKGHDQFDREEVLNGCGRKREIGWNRLFVKV